MTLPPPGATAIVFLSHRTAADDAGYTDAAAAMTARAAAMPGYLGFDTSREAGLGVTISWWADEASALRWRDDPVHAAIRERGRAVWYDWYRVIVCTVDRAYAWSRTTPASPA